MERHLKYIRMQKVKPQNENIVINADEHPEVLKQLLEEESNIYFANESYINGIEGDLQEYDRMILEEVKTEFEAVNLKRLLIDRQMMLFAVKKDCEGEELDRFDDAIKKSSLLLDKLECKIFEIKQTTKPEISFEYDRKMIIRVYDFLIDEKVFNCEIDVFISCVKTANFKDIFIKGNIKNKIKCLIFKLYEVGSMDENWYTKATDSINVSKNHMHSNELSKEWKDKLMDKILHSTTEKTIKKAFQKY